MKYILLFVILLSGLLAEAQGYPPGYTGINSRYDWLAGRFRALHIPAFNGVPTLTTGQWVGDGALAMDSTTGQVYRYYNGSYAPISGGSTNTNVGSGYRLAVIGGNTVKTLFNGYGLGWDSTTNTNGLTPTIDTLTANIGLATVGDVSRAIGGGAWSITGNAGTSPGTNFIGTTDDQDLVFKRNNFQAMRLRPDTVSFYGEDGRMAFSIFGTNDAVGGIAFVSIEDDTMKLVTGDQYLEMLSSLYIRNKFAGNPALSVNGNASQTGSVLQVVQTGVELFNVLPNGNVGINKNTPDSTLHVVGGLKFVTGRQGAGKVLTSNSSGGADWETPAAGVTASNGLTVVGSDVRLGGTLTAGTTTIGGAGEELIIDNIGTFVARVYDGVSAQSVLNIGTSTLEIRSNNTSGLNYASEIHLHADSIQINPHVGVLNIDSLRSWSDIADTLHKKPMTWDTRNGRWEYLDHWPSGGGGGSGTVTDFIFTDANGFDGTVSTSTSTPTLSLTTTVANTRVMFSNSGAITGSADFVWNGNTLTLTNSGGIGTDGLQIFNDNVGGNSVKIGFNALTNNSVSLDMGYVGSGSTSNSFNIAMAGAAAYNMTIQGTGNTGIRQTTPTGFLHIGAGTTSEVPFKLTEGSNATTPEDGAIEYTSNNLHFTEGSTRYTLLKTLTSAQAINFTSIAAGGNNQNTVTVTGAAIGDLVMVDQDITETNVIYTAWVSNTDTVTVRAYNSSASPIDPASATFRIVVVKF